jgi:hypothetical protein
MFENLKGLLIKETAWLNILRSVCAGFVWMIISFFLPNDGNSPFYIKLLYPLVFPIVLLMFYGIAQILKLFNLGGVGNIMCMLVTVPGDPLLFVLFKLKPELVPVKSLNILNFVGIILVYSDNIPASKKPPSTKRELLSCPFTGRIIADKEGSVMGFSWSTKGTIFNIDNDWNVTSNGTSFGWIDTNGQIRKGLKGNPIETLSPGSIIGKIENNILYINSKKAGELVKW